MDLRYSWLYLLIFLSLEPLLPQSGEVIVADLSSGGNFSDDEIIALESYLNHPVDLNRATADELWFLSTDLVGRLMTERDLRLFKSWEDVGRRCHLSPETVVQLRHYLYVDKNADLTINLSSRLVGTRGDEKITTRLAVNRSVWSLQWSIRREPQEYHLMDVSRGSLMIMIPVSGILATGYYRHLWGLGLVFARDFAARSEKTLLRAMDLAPAPRPTSAGQTHTFRGGMVHFTGHRASWSGGWSSQMIDVVEDREGNVNIVGYRLHREPGLKAWERIGHLAGMITPSSTFRFGALVAGYCLGSSSRSKKTERLIGSLVIQKEGRHPLGIWSWIMESAWGRSPGVAGDPPNAFQTRFLFRSHRSKALRAVDNFSLAAIFRRYPHGWTPVRGVLTGANVGRGNEWGWFIGWKWRHRQTELSGYFDRYEPVEEIEKGQGQAPGWESVLRLFSAVPGLGELSLAYKQEESSSLEDQLSEEGIWIQQHTKSRVRYLRGALNRQLLHSISAKLTLAYVGSSTGKASGGGTAAAAVIRVRPGSTWQASGGAEFFGTDGWRQRLYFYEDSLPGEFNLRPVYGRGMRWFGVIRADLQRGEISLRWSQQRRFSPSGDRRQDHQWGLQVDIAL